jgi:hypothetical protein
MSAAGGGTDGVVNFLIDLILQPGSSLKNVCGIVCYSWVYCCCWDVDNSVANLLVLRYLRLTVLACRYL